MSGFELDTQGWQNFLDDNAAQPQTEEKPGFFQGAIKGTVEGFGRGLTNLNDMLLTGTDLVYPMSDEERAQQENIRRKATDFFTPDPHTTGAAGRVLGGVAEGVAPLIIPVAGPALTVGSNTLATGKRLIDEGVDANTASASAAVDGLATAAGFKIPVVGNTAAQRIAAGVGGNIAFGLASREAQHEILGRRGYEELASNYSPLDGEALTVDALTGAVFGALYHKTAPSKVASVATVANAKHFQVDTAPGGIADVNSSVAHQAAMDAGLDQAMRGEPVNVPPEVLNVDFTRRPPREVPIPPELKELDANRAARAAMAPEVAVEEAGRVITVRTPGGFTEARVKGDEFLQITNTETAEAARGRGEGTARMQKLLAIAEERGLTLASDTKVSPAAARFYERLAREGFTVIRNAARADGEGHLVSEDSRPIFEVHPKGEGYSGAHGQPGIRPELQASQDLGAAREGTPQRAGGEGNGRPRTVRAFRGGVGELTAGEFGRGAVTGATTQPTSGLGVRFSKSAEHAADYGNVSEHTLTFQNPKVLKVEDFPHFRTAKEYRDFANELRAQGYDSLAVTAAHHGGPVDFFAFDQSQVQGLAKPEAKAGAEAIPEVAAAREFVAGKDLQIPTGEIDAEGNPVTRSAREALAQAEADIKQAEDDAKGFEAAVSCWLTRGPDAQ